MKNPPSVAFPPKFHGCGEVGHLQRDCRRTSSKGNGDAPASTMDPRPRCFGCGKVGHLRRDCRSLQGPGPSSRGLGSSFNEESSPVGFSMTTRSPEVILRPGGRTGFRPYVSQGEVQSLNGSKARRITMLRDTGSARTLIRKSALPDPEVKRKGVCTIKGISSRPQIISTYQVRIHGEAVRGTDTSGLVGALERFPYEDVDMILGNDLGSPLKLGAVGYDSSVAVVSTNLRPRQGSSGSVWKESTATTGSLRPRRENASREAMAIRATRQQASCSLEEHRLPDRNLRGCGLGERRGHAEQELLEQRQASLERAGTGAQAGGKTVQGLLAACARTAGADQQQGTVNSVRGLSGLQEICEEEPAFPALGKCLSELKLKVQDLRETRRLHKCKECDKLCEEVAEDDWYNQWMTYQKGSQNLTADVLSRP